ncbi:type VI secretion system baseplate subunit TssE [Pseudoalteromonas sp. C2R02]|uniref:type VI secretion system baseplate subunit TssE n=1 Tax=Pseudoalteromonas sp. C2R02 TaxID=2841565 RepID=UPI001C089AB2|nr:type VI secretion system baseplate subunit TssE [Pseudoalteromonas sp. C2R02]MBU2968405.1 type VI secretion system baseplate subunit TssE [Pseudoalteromonas sp. C2R02]
MSQFVSPEIQSSVLDKLIDDDPLNPDPKEAIRGINLKQLRSNVCRDLENLLNTKMQWHVWPASFEELNKSVLSYGLPDFSSIAVGSSEGRQILCEQVAKTIKMFEPRFIEVEVFIIEDEQEVDQTLRIRINALLYAEPEPQYITFNSEVEPVHLGMVVKEKIE